MIYISIIQTGFRRKSEDLFEESVLGVVVEVYLQAIIYTINKHVFHMQSVVQEELKAPAKSEN